jgi:hypothetical protein
VPALSHTCGSDSYANHICKSWTSFSALYRAGLVPHNVIPSVNKKYWIVYLRITIDLMTSLEQKESNNPINIAFLPMSMSVTFSVYVCLAPSKVTHIHVPHLKPYKNGSEFYLGILILFLMQCFFWLVFLRSKTSTCRVLSACLNCSSMRPWPWVRPGAIHI